jgi:hypothetical protein
MKRRMLLLALNVNMDIPCHWDGSGIAARKMLRTVAMGLVAMDLAQQFIATSVIKSQEKKCTFSFDQQH